MFCLQQNIGTDGILTRSAFGEATNLTSLCPNGSQWIWEGLGECAQDARDMASIYLGLLSILCFMVSSLPYVSMQLSWRVHLFLFPNPNVCNSWFLLISRQCYSSFKAGNMDSALSIWFLLLWLGGDSCNLIGSFLANQLPLQVKPELLLQPRCNVLSFFVILFSFIQGTPCTSMLASQKSFTLKRKQSLIPWFSLSSRYTQPYTTYLLTWWC